MQKNKKIRWIALLCCLLFLMAGQTIAFAGVPYEIEVGSGSSGVHLTYTAGDTNYHTLVMKIKDVNANDLNKVTFSFPGNYFIPISAVAGGQTGTVQGNVVSFETIKPTVTTTTNPDNSVTETLDPNPQEITVTFTVVGNQTTATTEPQTETVTVSYGGSNQNKTADVKVVVEPAVIDISKTTFVVDYLQYHKQPHLNESPAKALATVVVNFADQYGNPSKVWPTDKSVYLAAEGVAGFTDITQTATNGNYKPIVNDKDQFYELNNITDTKTILQVKGQLGSSYTFALGLGDQNATDSATIRSYFSNGVKTPIDYKVAKLNITGINVSTHNDGQIKIDVSIPNFDLTGKTVEVKLPANFMTKETKENGLLTVPANGSLFANVVSVPAEGTYNYTNTDGDYKLYIDGVEYMLTNYDGCVIVVEPSLLQVLIDNELEFRHGTGNEVIIPQKLTFTISGIDTSQVDKIEFKIGMPQQATGSTGSVEMKFKNDGTGSYIYDAAANTVIVSGQFSETQTFTFPVEYANSAAIVEGLNEVYPIEIITRKSSGDLVEKSNNVQLRYRITNAVIDVLQTTFTDFRTVSVVGNQCAVEIKMTINEPELNGRGVYLWITDEHGEIVNIKDRFDIQLIGTAADTLFLMNTELAAVEGSVKGDRNVFKVFLKGTDTAVNSIEQDGPNLGVKEMLFRITSSLDGNFRLNIGTGRTAQEALANSETVGTLNHKESDIFTFIQESDLPIINIRNLGDIYYNYLAAGLDKPGPGILEVEIANIKFPEDPSVPDNLYIRLPAGLVLYPTSDEKYGKYNENGYLKLNQNNALAKDETTSKNHYRWQIPFAEITNALTTEELRNNAEERLVDGTEFTYYRGMNEQKKQEIRVDITSDLTFKAFVANLYQFLQVSFGTPAYPAEDIALTIAPQETIYSSEAFNNSTGILFWFSNGSESILTAEQVTVKATTLDGEGKEVTNNLEAVTDGSVTENQNKFKLDWKLDEQSKPIPGVLAEKLAVQFAAVGDYQLNIALILPSTSAIAIIDAEADDTEEENTPAVPNPAADIAVPNTTATMYVQVQVTEKPVTPEQPETEETWNLALKVDGADYTATNHVYTVTGKKIGNKIAVTGKLTDKAGNPLVGVNVAVSGEVWTYTGTTTAVTSATGEFAFEISASTEGTPHLLTLALNSTLTENTFATTYSVQITVTDGSVEETLSEYTVDKVKVVSTVAVDDMAVVYLDVYDKNYNRIEITSNAQARGIFKDVEFRYLPDRSDLYDGDIFIRANNGGIEVYFYPDYRGDYYIRMTTNSGGGQIINASFEAVWQDKIVDIQLLYPEKTLGIGQTSSAAQIITYDKNGVEAEVAVVRHGWECYYQGSAVQSMDEWGRVTLKDNERYIGSTVSVIVYNTNLGLTSTYTFNVEDNSYIEEDGGLDVSGIVLPDDFGAISRINQYQFYLVDRNGFTVQLAPGQMSSYNGAEAEVTVYSKPYGANVTAYVSNNGQSMEDNGFGYLYVYCDKPGTVRLNVHLKIYNPRTVNNYVYSQYEYYSKTVSIEIKEKANVNQAISTDKTLNQNKGTYDTSVAIFLGTNHYRVNMNERIGEAMPIFRDGKIMVPVRTLTDGLGGKFEYNPEKKTITMRVDGDWAIATIGSNIIKTNYGSVYSDVVPFVEGGYTYLPLRAAAEVLGCEVEAVSDVSGNVIGAIFLR